MKRAFELPSVVAAVLIGLGLPAFLASALTFMRPDLIGPLLEHPLGYRCVLIEVLFCLAGTTLYLAAALLRFKTGAPRVLLVLAGGLFFTLPAVLGVLFGPILFAFHFG